MLAALDVPPGATVADAVARSRVFERIGVPPGSLAYAIFGHRVTRDTPLADGDRIEVTRPLQCDPALARREARRRAGAPREAPGPDRPRQRIERLAGS